MSSSSCTTISRSTGTLKKLISAGDRAAGLVHVRQRRSRRRPWGRAPRRAARRGGPRTATARALCERRLALARAASSSMTMAPTLCRLPAYVGPGLPSPTTSQRSVEAMGGDAVERADRSGRLRPRRCPRRQRRGLGALGLGLRGLVLDAGLGLGLGELGLQRLGGDRRGDVDDEDLRVGDQRGALGQDQVGGVDLGAGREALDGDLDALGDVGRLDLELDGLVLHGDHGLDGGLALGVDLDVDGDLLAAADDDEVDVLDDRLIGVALDVLGQGQLGLAVDLDGQQGVGRLAAPASSRGPGG